MIPILQEKKIVPVVKLDRVEDACPLAEALCEGGLPVAEITFRTDAAEESIRRIRAAFPEMLVGAGTIINTEQAKRATDAGAAFLVSPGISEEILEFAEAGDLPVFPGVCTPSEIMLALRHGLRVVKFFPAEAYGGIRTMKALSGPFPGILFMPTGGISPGNLVEYLSYERVAAVGGSWMVKASLIKDGFFDEISRLTAEAVAMIKGAGGQ